MREINLIGGFYQAKSLTFSAQDTVNWLPVIAKAEGARSPIKLRGLPGLNSINPSVIAPQLGDYSLLHFDSGDGTQDTGTRPLTWSKFQDFNGGILPVVSTDREKFGPASARFECTGPIGVSGYYGATIAEAVFDQDFTIEAFIYQPTVGSTEGAVVIGFFNLGFSTSGVLLQPGTNQAYSVIAESVGPIFNIPPRNQWWHCVYQRRGNTYEVFVDGVLVSSRTRTVIHGINCTARVGLRFTGWIDEHRITFGRAVYPTSGFTPPIAPFQDAPGS